MQPKIKICGMTDRRNIQEIMTLRPDYLGFIFYPKSKRYVGESFDFSILRTIGATCKVAVFVDADIRTIEAVVKKGLFDAVQLHGQENVAFCKQVKEMGVKVMKAFGVFDGFDWEPLTAYQEAVDYFLFDTKTPLYGGSGRTFDWKLLEVYPLAIPFFLSGGMAPHNLSSALGISDPRLHALDLNSQFELRPGIKDITLLKSNLKDIRI